MKVRADQNDLNIGDQNMASRAVCPSFPGVIVRLAGDCFAGELQTSSHRKLGETIKPPQDAEFNVVTYGAVSYP
jgi:hypothetical protein